MQTESKTEYPKCVQAKLDELADAMRRVEACATLGRICDEVAAEFPNSFVCMPNVGTFTHYIDIHDSLDEAVALIRAYRKRGIKMKDFKDLPGSAVREYFMEGLSIYATLGRADEGSAARCKFVKIGTKTVEQPVYEIKCDGEESKP